MLDDDAFFQLLGRAAFTADRATTYRGVLRFWRDPVLQHEAARQHRRLHPSGHSGFDDPPRRPIADEPFHGLFAVACRLPDPPLTRHLEGTDWVGASGPDRASMQQHRFIGALGAGAAATPLALMAGCRVTRLGPSQAASPPASRVELRFRTSPLRPLAHLEWPGGEQRLLDLDEATGFVLRCEDRFGDAPFEIAEFTSIDVGAVLSSEDLTSDLRLLAPDEFVRTEEPLSFREAAEMTEYRLLAPGRVPAGCEAQCQVHRGSTHVGYAGEDGRIWLSIEMEPSQSRIREELARFEQVGTDDHPVYLWESPSGSWGRSVAIVEQAGTRARLHSPLGRESLIEMARSMRPFE